MTIKLYCIHIYIYTYIYIYSLTCSYTDRGALPGLGQFPGLTAVLAPYSDLLLRDQVLDDDLGKDPRIPVHG